jgi:ABC-2 type transport system permease protein
LSAGADAAAQRGRPLRGPSAITGNRRQFWDLLLITSFASFRNRYVDTVFGFVWMFLGPLMLFGVLYVFVTQIIERFNQIPHYGELLLLNITLYNLFRAGSSTAMRSLVGSGLVRKMAVPRLVLPLSAIATAFYAMLANMVIVIPWILISGVEPTWTWLLFPVVIFGMLLITCSFGLLLAGAFVRFRDVGQVWPVLTNVLFYASPVIWPFGIFRDEILWDAQIFNPIAPVLAQARTWIIDPSTPGWFEVRGTGFDAFLPFIVLAVIAVAGVAVFRRESRRAAEDL